MTDFWRDKKVLVTGGGGFVGSYVVQALLRRGVPESHLRIPRARDCDLRSVENCRSAVVGQDVVIHLAAQVGGIGYNRAQPARLFYDNLMMGAQLMEAARQAGVSKFVSVGTACSYPKILSTPFREEDLWDGYPEETNAPYGLAKKMLLVQAQAYYEQYGMKGAVVIPFNAYGPRDNFDPQRSHVIPALIRKCLEEEELVVWGDGSPSRSFVHAQDIAEGVLLAAEKIDQPVPINIGTEDEIRIRDLVALIAELCDFRGPIVYDTSKPNGQPRRRASIARARELLGYEPRRHLREGLSETIDWYREQARVPARS